MAADAGIFGLIQQPRSINPLAGLLEVQQIQGIQQQNQLAQLAFAQRQQEAARAEAQRAAVAGFGDNPQENYRALLRTGDLGAAKDYQNQILAADKARSETQRASVETGTKAFDQYRALLGTVQDPRQAAQVVAASYNDPVVGPLLQRMGPLEEGLQRLQQQASTPEGFQNWKAQAAIGMEKLAEMAKVQNVNLGGQVVTQAVQPATGQVTQLGAQQVTISPDAQLSATQSDINSRRSTSASMANAAAQREIANATRDAARISSDAKSETELRKEFADLPEVKKYKNAIPAYQAVVKAAKTNNPQADINLIYGLAKLYDPDSVVREGEYATIANSQAIPEWLKGQAQRLVGGGRLTEATKKQIIDQATIRKDTFESEFNGAQESYAEIARRRNMNPENIFPKVGEQVRSPAAPAGSGFTIISVN